ncbi:glycoprotein [Wenzhou Crab Virus 3]|uniref:Glycoprotein n=1 Tax=Wenzhou Crab Virus 3 TaxID=1608093 RepID=A0A0B5KX90_9VIRU|nr:glycoprotein [Wenzhou Crab Virus 3]AJG39063.1 glycoprotein [Wenzhou Crab Virus 3]
MEGHISIFILLFLMIPVHDGRFIRSPNGFFIQEVDLLRTTGTTHQQISLISPVSPMLGVINHHLAFINKIGFHCHSLIKSKSKAKEDDHLKQLLSYVSLAEGILTGSAKYVLQFSDFNDTSTHANFDFIATGHDDPFSPDPELGDDRSAEKIIFLGDTLPRTKDDTRVLAINVSQLSQAYKTKSSIESMEYLDRGIPPMIEPKDDRMMSYQRANVFSYAGYYLFGYARGIDVAVLKQSFDSLKKRQDAIIKRAQAQSKFNHNVEDQVILNGDHIKDLFAHQHYLAELLYHNSEILKQTYHELEITRVLDEFHTIIIDSLAYINNYLLINLPQLHKFNELKLVALSKDTGRLAAVLRSSTGYNIVPDITVLSIHGISIVGSVITSEASKCGIPGKYCAIQVESVDVVLKEGAAYASIPLPNNILLYKNTDDISEAHPVFLEGLVQTGENSWEYSSLTTLKINEQASDCILNSLFPHAKHPKKCALRFRTFDSPVIKLYTGRNHSALITSHGVKCNNFSYPAGSYFVNTNTDIVCENGLIIPSNEIADSFKILKLYPNLLRPDENYPFFVSDHYNEHADLLDALSKQAKNLMNEEGKDFLDIAHDQQKKISMLSDSAHQVDHQLKEIMRTPIVAADITKPIDLGSFLGIDWEWFIGAGCLLILLGGCCFCRHVQSSVLVVSKLSLVMALDLKAIAVEEGLIGCLGFFQSFIILFVVVLIYKRLPSLILSRGNEPVYNIPPRFRIGRPRLIVGKLLIHDSSGQCIGTIRTVLDSLPTFTGTWNIQPISGQGLKMNIGFMGSLISGTLDIKACANDLIVSDFTFITVDKIKIENKYIISNFSFISLWRSSPLTLTCAEVTVTALGDHAQAII